jgi:hypothetical protein
VVAASSTVEGGSGMFLRLSPHFEDFV